MGLSKGDQWEWFQANLDKLDADNSATIEGFELAYSVLESGALVERWRGWVCQTVQDALSRARSNPVGLWLTLLRQGPGGDLTKPATKAQTAQAAHAIRAAETDAYIAEINATPRAPAPSMVAVCDLKECRGMTYVEALAVVTAEWERQGQPWPEDFDRARLGLEVAR